MTELEKRLTDALTALSEQYEREQRRQAEQYEALQKRMQRLEEAVKDLKPQLGADRSAGRGFEAAGQTLGGGLQRDRRSVERSLKSYSANTAAALRTGARLWP